MATQLELGLRREAQAHDGVKFKPPYNLYHKYSPPHHLQLWWGGNGELMLRLVRVPNRTLAEDDTPKSSRLVVMSLILGFVCVRGAMS